MHAVTTSRLALAAAATALAFTIAAPASAYPRYREQAHADSFGNLVVYSPSGYKRIVVDKGYLAEELNAYGRAEAGPSVVEAPASSYQRPCRRYPLRAQGRGYMYGLPDHVVPVFTTECQ